MFKSILILVALLATQLVQASPVVMPEGDPDAESRGWTPWVSLGGGITSDPAACTAGNWTYVFARGTDNTIFYRFRSLASGVWSNWFRLSTQTTTGSPAAACAVYPNGSYRVHVFIRGPGGPIWMKGGFHGNWGGWTSLGGATYPGSGPAAAWNPVGNRLEVFMRGADGTMYRKYRYYGTWRGWTRVSSTIKSDPAVAMWSTSHFDIFALGTTGQLWSRFWDGGAWYPSTYHAGVITSSADAVTRGVGLLDVFSRGTSYQLLWKTQVQGGWSGWTNLGGYLTSGPGATTYASNARIMVFVRGSDGALWYRAWAP